MDGILLFNKPVLWTSHDAVDFIRRQVGQRAVGHAGTLDPLATGLLVILLGRATKLSQALSASEKSYSGGMTLGVETDTQDLEGMIVSVEDPQGVDAKDVETSVAQMIGVQEQVPPSYSAVKKNGKSLYQWARQGTAVEANARQISIRDFRVTAILLPEVYFEIVCSRGTYVRTICQTLGRKLGCGAVLSSLLRTRCGDFDLKQAVNHDQVNRMAPAAIERCLVKEMHEDLQRI